MQCSYVHLQQLRGEVLVIGGHHLNGQLPQCDRDTEIKHRIRSLEAVRHKLKQPFVYRFINVKINKVKSDVK
ncbi:hypothetical protein D3C77_245510 [compost metagenome]